jgi:hypothetical protein
MLLAGLACTGCSVVKPGTTGAHWYNLVAALAAGGVAFYDQQRSLNVGSYLGRQCHSCCERTCLRVTISPPNKAAAAAVWAQCQQQQSAGPRQHACPAQGVRMTPAHSCTPWGSNLHRQQQHIQQHQQQQQQPDSMHICSRSNMFDCDGEVEVVGWWRGRGQNTGTPTQLA